MAEGSKRCVQCGEEKPLEGGFRRNGKSRDGYERRCIPCRESDTQPSGLDEKRRKHAEKMRRWRQENPEAARAAGRRKLERIKEDPERYDRYLERQRGRDRSAYLRSPKGSAMRRRSDRQHLLRKYGIELEDYDRLLEQQAGVCAICGSPPLPGRPYKALAVDHCHETGSIRGLLCDLCNRGLGMFKDSPDLLESALAYLRLQAEGLPGQQGLKPA